MSFILALIITWLVRNRTNLGWLKTIVLFLAANGLLLRLGDLISIIMHEYYYVVNYYRNNDISSSIMGLAFILGLVTLIYYIRNPNNRYLKNWKKSDHPLLSSVEFSNVLSNNCDLNNVRYYEDIPYNRALYFSTGTEADIERENVSLIFYDAQPSDKEMSFQEYGYLVTSSGVIVKKQIKLKNGEKKYDVDTTYLPFADAYWFSANGDCLTVFYADKTKRMVCLKPEELAFLSEVFQYAIQSSWTYHVESVLNEDSITKDEFESRMKDLDSAIEKAELGNKIDKENKQTAYASVGRILRNVNSELNQNQINDRFGDGQGHGHVGEQYGDLKDKLQFNRTEKFGASHEKNGADRAVNGENIQTKYHATAGKSIDGLFYNKEQGGGAKYLNPDGTMMKIEVPKDQYSDALKKMAKKIKDGRVPGERNPANAVKYVKKGALTYEHAQIATKSIFDRNSTITIRDSKGKVVKDSNGKVMVREVKFSEKLIWSAGGDFLTGATATLPFGVVSGVWVYCNSVWQGADQKTALKNSAIATAKPCLTGGVIYMVSSQFAGSQVGKKAGDVYVKHFLKGQISNKVKTQLVQKGTMGVVTVIITVGPDLSDCLRGRISVNQLVKNTVSTGAGIIVGAKAGAIVGSFVPGVGTAIGTVVGGAIGGTAAGKIMNNFIEDDAVSMIRIAKEEFINTVMMSGLSQEEFDSILNQTFLHKKFSNQLKEMFVANNSRAYIHGVFLELVEEAFKQRELPTEEEIIEVAAMHYSNLQLAA